LATSLQINPVIKEQRKSRVPRFSDELSSDQRLEDPEKTFKVHTFYPILDTAVGQLTSRFEGQQLVTQNFSFLIPRNICQLSVNE